MTTIYGKTSTILGIDPGASGGLARWKSGEPVSIFSMPGTEGDLLDLLKSLAQSKATVVFIEEVSGFAGKQQPGSAMFKFGRHFGFTLGVLQTLGIRVDLVRPQKWQKPLGLGTASSCPTRTEWKNKLKSCAQRRYPALKTTLTTADAILILDYASAFYARKNEF